MPRLYHPICHLVNGERLYYLFIVSRLNVGDTERCIAGCMKTEALKKIENSYCMYFTFGENDLILRVWARERQFTCLLDELRNRKREGIDDFSVRIVDSLSTWYQRAIEARFTWPGQLDANNLDDLIVKDPLPSYFIKDYAPINDKKEDNVFLLDLRQAYSEESNLFRELVSSVVGEDEKFRKCFEDIQRISIYSYYFKTHKGVLVKGQTSELDLIANVTRNVSEQFGVDATTTHICFSKRPLAKSGDGVSNRVFNESRSEVIYNLLKSYDCYEKILGPEAVSRKNAFCDQLSTREVFRDLFAYRSDWWSFREEVHKLFRWVVFGKNGPLIDYLRGHYVYYEGYFDDKLKNLAYLEGDDDKSLLRSLRKQIPSVLKGAKISDIDEEKLGLLVEKMKRFFKRDERTSTEKSYVTFGEVPRLLGSLTSLTKLSQDEDDAIKDLISAVTTCVPNRNTLMHRSLNLLSYDKKSGEYAWKSYTLSLIKLMFAFRRHKATFEGLITDLGEISLSGKTSGAGCVSRKVRGSKAKSGAAASRERVGRGFENGRIETLPLSKRNFGIGLSFSDRRRPFVAEVAEILTDRFGKNSTFYDRYFEAVLARRNMAIDIVEIFLDRCDLGVAFICSAYKDADWCMREWNAMLAKSKQRGQRKKEVMVLRFDKTNLPGFREEIDGYVEIRGRSPEKIAQLIIARYESDFSNEGAS